MTHRALALAAVATTALAACPSDDAPPMGNPSRLWLTLDMTEVEVKLSPVEPPPF